MIERLISLSFACAIWGVVFGICYFAWSRPTPGFVGEPFWDKGKVVAGLVLASVLILDVIFESDLRSRTLYAGFGSLALIWFSEVLLFEILRERMGVLPKSEAVRTTGIVFHYFWAIIVIYAVLFG